MQTISVQTGKPYEVLVGPGILPELGRRVRDLGQKYKKAAVITDDKVDALYGDAAGSSLRAAGYDVIRYTFPNGESSKNSQILLDILGFLCDNYLTRSDLIVALGGGVTGDMAGFAASVYLRGIDYIQVPTTLLAALDSSVGGKTAVNIPQGKNLVGSFWQPRLVLCDTDTLATLDDETFADGVAEAVKYGCIWDAVLFAKMEQDGFETGLEDIIARCVAIKAEVVRQDELDNGLRQILNFGHTLGHAVEKLSGFAISHGKAVAIGMCLVSAACVKSGSLTGQESERIRNLLQKNSLPTDSPYPLEELCVACLGDKKRSGDQISLILLDEIGKAVIQPVPVDQLHSFLQP